MGVKYTSYVFDEQSGQYVRVSTTSSGTGPTYNQLLDQPIVNVHGSSEYSFVNIAELGVGEYNMSGYYKYSGSSELLSTGSDYIHMVITNDTETGKKTAVFDTCENGDVVTNTIIYNGSSVETFIKRGSGAYWGHF